MNPTQRPQLLNDPCPKFARMTTESHLELWRGRAIFKPYQEVMERQFWKVRWGHLAQFPLEERTAVSAFIQMSPVCPLTQNSEAKWI